MCIHMQSVLQARAHYELQELWYGIYNGCFILWGLLKIEVSFFHFFRMEYSIKNSYPMNVHQAFMKSKKNTVILVHSLWQLKEKDKNCPISEDFFQMKKRSISKDFLWKIKLLRRHILLCL